MKKYINANGNAGIIAYESGSDFIKIKFRDGETYLYNYKNPGKLCVEKMKMLAEKGNGLTTFINKNVRENFAQKV